jgi:hypothetical protein
VRWLSKFNSKFTIFHWTLAKNVLRYLKGTKSVVLKYGPGDPTKLCIYADASYASETESARSVTGYVIKQGNNLIAWKSRTQTTVAKSTMEAEYMALSDAVSDCYYFLEISKEIKLKVSLPINLYSDNQAAIHVATSDAPTKRTKHINVRYHNVKEQIADGTFTIQYVKTEQQQADLLTKNLPIKQLAQFRQMLQLSKLGGISTNEEDLRTPVTEFKEKFLKQKKSENSEEKSEEKEEISAKMTHS